MEMYQSAVDGQWESLLECSQQSLMRHESVCNYVAMAHAHSMKVRRWDAASLTRVVSGVCSADGFCVPVSMRASACMIVAQVRSLVALGDLLGAAVAAKSMLAALGKRAGSDLYLLHVNLAVKVWPYVRVPGLATKSSPGLMPHPLSHTCGESARAPFGS